jgi:hypothetical protein
MRITKHGPAVIKNLALLMQSTRLCRLKWACMLLSPEGDQR